VPHSRVVGKASENDNVKTYLPAAAQQIALQRNAAAAGTSLERLGRGSTVAYDLIDRAPVDPGLAEVVAFVFALRIDGIRDRIEVVLVADRRRHTHDDDAAVRRFLVSSSAGKNDSIASSATVTFIGVPKTVVTLMNDSS
jgi:hypothetical protein